MPIKGEQGYTYKALINGEWQDITIAESPLELLERFEQDEEWAKVVRCKDCKYYFADGCEECVLMHAKSITASIMNKRWYSDFFCAWGERREDAKTD